MDAGASHCRPVTGLHGAVAAAHPAAVSAGTQVLAAGGGAVDAMIAAQAVVCVLMPHASGLGGDLMALVRPPGGRVVAVNGSGRSASAGRGDGAGDGAGHGAGQAVTVPGLVDAWVTAHERWGSLPLRRLLAPAVALAEQGAPLGEDVAAAVAAQRPRLLAGGARAWSVLVTAAGQRVRQPELAGLLRAVGDVGRNAFYTGPAAEALVRAVRASGGALSTGDLAGHRTPVGAPLTVPWRGGHLHVQPPMSQGVLLAMAAQWLASWSDQHGPPPSDADGDDLQHVLVEATEAAFAHRDDCARGAGLLAVPLDVDPARAARRGGPRAYLHTAGVAAADARGGVATSLVSVFDDFGSAVFVPEAGIVLNNRGNGFTAGANAPAAGAAPVHTLAPALVTHPDGSVLALATPGADGQVQTLLQVLARLAAGASTSAALAAPRWRSEGGALLVENGHPAAGGLRGRGHDVVVRESGDGVFGAVVAAGVDTAGPFAAADWRRTTWSGVA